MKRYLISSPAFTGDAEIFFDGEGRLIKLDFMHTNMTPSQVQAFKAKVPALVNSLGDAFADTKATIVLGSLEFTSEDFMREYPYKRNSHLVHAYWPKMPQTDQAKAFYAATEYRKYCEKNKWYNPKIPAAWLKDKEYLNDWKKM